MVNFLGSIWKNLHWAEKNYLGGCDKYEVWLTAEVMGSGDSVNIHTGEFGQVPISSLKEKV